MNAAFHRKFGTHLYHERPLEERLEDARRYRRLVVGGQDDFKRFVSELNEIINESVDHGAVRRLLTSRGVTTPEGARGNKLLEAVYKEVLGDTNNLIGPFFYLYDLRLWADHAIPDGRRLEITRALGVSDPNSYVEIMDSLVARLAASANAIKNMVDAA